VSKVKVIPQQAEVAHGLPGRLIQVEQDVGSNFNSLGQLITVFPGP